MIIKLCLLFYEYFKIGLFAVGGGLATLPFIYNLYDVRPEWFNNDSSFIMDMVAVSESTPGALGVNMSTYTGFTVGGVLGGITTTLGLVAPSIIVIVIIAKFLEKFRDSPTVEKVFYGIRPASIGLVASAGYIVVTEALLNIEAFMANYNITELFRLKSIIFAAILFVAMNKLKTHPVWFILISAIVGNLVVF